MPLDTQDTLMSAVKTNIIISVQCIDTCINTNLDMVPQLKVISVVLQILTYVCVLHKRWQIFLEREIRESHDFCGQVCAEVKGKFSRLCNM